MEWKTDTKRIYCHLQIVAHVTISPFELVWYCGIWNALFNKLTIKRFFTLNVIVFINRFRLCFREIVKKGMHNAHSTSNEKRKENKSLHSHAHALSLVLFDLSNFKKLFILIENSRTRRSFRYATIYLFHSIFEGFKLFAIKIYEKERHRNDHQRNCKSAISKKMNLMKNYFCFRFQHFCCDYKWSQNVSSPL